MHVEVPEVEKIRKKYIFTPDTENTVRLLLALFLHCTQQASITHIIKITAFVLQSQLLASLY